MDDNQACSALSGHIGKLLRDTFGKGPQSIHINVKRPIIVIQLKQFLSPMEHILIGQQREETVEQTRDLLMDRLIPEIKAFINVIVGMEIQDFYYDWSFHNGSGVMVGIEDEGVDASNGIQDESYAGKMELHAEIDRISAQVQKSPESISSCLINGRTLVVIRDGILVPIEKELSRLGYEGVLKRTKRSLEKRYLHNNVSLGIVLQTQILDIFVDWSLQLDKSVIVMILKPTSYTEGLMN